MKAWDSTCLATGPCQTLTYTGFLEPCGIRGVQIKGAGDVRLGLRDGTQVEGKSELNVEVRGATEDLSPNS